MLIQELQQIGLSEKEAQVYLACLELGQATVQKISQKAKINRATAYFILDLLRKRGLVSSVEKGKTSLFAAEPPEQLINVLKKQEIEIQQKEKHFRSILPDLRSIYNLIEEKPIVRYYEGIEGLRTMQEDFLKTNDKEIEAIFSKDDVDRVFENENIDHVKRRMSKGIKSRVIFTSSKGDIFQKDADKYMRSSLHIDQRKYPILCDITFYDHKIAIANLRGKLSGVIIESKDVITTMRSIFNLAWEGAKKEDK